jgi:glycogen phosphorylase
LALCRNARGYPVDGIDARWQVVPAWTRASILNVARMPWFSSNRTIREYAEDIWHVPVRAAGPVPEADVQRGAKG